MRKSGDHRKLAEEGRINLATKRTAKNTGRKQAQARNTTTASASNGSIRPLLAKKLERIGSQLERIGSQLEQLNQSYRNVLQELGATQQSRSMAAGGKEMTTPLHLSKATAAAGTRP